MRGTIPGARPRFGAALGAVAVAAMLVGARVPPALSQENRDDMAFAVPRLALPPNEPVALPRPLSAAAARQIRQALLAPAMPLDGLADHLLDGHILAERYFAANSHPTAAELQAWLAENAALPEAG